MTVQAQGRPWRGISPQARDAARRSRLLAAGLEVFGTTGYRSATVAGLCRTAQVSTRSFYELFADREELLAAVYRGITDEITERIGELRVEPGAAAATWVTAAVDSVVGPMLEDERKGIVAEVEVVGVSARLEEERRAAHAGIANALDAAFDALIADRLVAPFPKGQLATFAVGGVSEMLVVHLRSDPAQRGTRVELTAEMARLLLRIMT